jgi:uncharacterized protein with NRDE domain
MCLAIIALDAHPRFALVVAANRDEFHARPAIAAAWGEAPPFAGVLAGRDVEAGGTWFGVRRDGRWALVTNVREGGLRAPGARSRGELVPQVLAHHGAPLDALRAIAPDGARYNGFNLLGGTRAHAAWTSNRAREVVPLPAGLHGLSNALLDTPWPKVARMKGVLAGWCARGDDDLAPLFAALFDRTRASDANLPATGVTLERERMLSAPFIVSDDYGTRCSTVFTIDRHGHAHFHERSFDPRGEPTGDAVSDFGLD